ncbi:ESPR-type extended signal peptide-containing protein [Megasphaera sp. UPII 135-E]|uniref:ESPR-type extended signal peptide-containing protein n=1 Tax=Megasphaera sp. UPII 135-E TaxID=1000569 RepID=UPI000564A667|nr:ESPR-type extended signal peptide-containing protein [Megasphaera sp. UPII 135-E]
MNKIFKVIWSETKHAYCVVSEIVHTHSRASTRRTKAALVAVLILTSSALGQGVQADGTNSYSWGSGSEATGDQSVAAGDSAKALGEGSTAVGQGAQAKERFSTALGQNAHAEKEFSTALGVSAQAKGAWSTALGQNAIAEKDYSTALGYYAQAQGDASTAVGDGAQAPGLKSTALGAQAQAQSNYSMALGYKANAQGDQSTALGKEAQAQGDLSIAVGQGAIANGIYSIALGKEAQTKCGFSVAVGGGAQANGNQSIALGYLATAEKDYAVALGNQAKAQGQSSIALGDDVHAEKDHSVALGWRAQAQGNYSMALGHQAQAWLEGSVALGSGSVASIDKGVKGYDPFTGKASTETSVVWQATRAAFSVGSTSDINYLITRQITGVAAGTQDTDAVNVAQLKALNTKVDKGAVHYFSVKSTEKGENSNRDNDGATGEDAVAIGVGAQAKGGASTALGLGVIAEKDSSTAVGCSAYAQGEFSTALGYKANAQGNFSMALGQEAQALEVSSTALGSGAKALLDGSVALGFGSIASIGKGVVGYDPFAGKASTENSAIWKATQAALSVGSTVDGNNLITRQITGVAAGSEDTDAVNVAQLKALNAKVDKGAVHYFSVNSSKPANPAGTNWDNDGATGDGAVAIGNGAQAQGNSSTALGHQATAEGDYSTALGYGAQAPGESSTALGREAQAQERFSMALGREAQALGESSTALGRKAQALVEGSVALGEGTVAVRKEGTVGYIALGGSATFEDALKTLNKKEDYDKWKNKVTNELKTKYDKLTQACFNADPTDQIDKKSALNKWKGEHKDFVDALEKKSKLEATWKATKAAVSVGADGLDEVGNRIIESRQITNVAAGTKDTDAVNVAQLKVLNGKVDTLGTKIEDVKKIADGNKIHYFSVNNTDTSAGSNWDNDGATREDAVAIGHSVISDGFSSTALGGGARATKDYSTALGHRADALGVSSVALGSGASAEGFSSTALGNDAKALWAYSTALGYKAEARVDGSVALGSDSIASIDKGVFGYDPSTGKASTETSAIWKATRAAFSVGSTVDGNNLITRQITGVAAGTQDTDAVNVAQLKALEKKLIKVLPEVVGDQKTGVVVEKNLKENTSIPSTSETAPPTGGVTTSLTSRTTPPTGVTTPPTGVTTPPTSETAPPTSVTAQPTGVTTTTTAPTDESKTVYKVKLDKKVDVGNISIDGNENKETITIGKGDNHVIVNNTGLTIANGPSVTKSGINANKNKITNVGDGTISEDSTEAVNGKQLYGVEQDVKRNTKTIDNLQNNMYDMGMKVGELDTRVNKVGAGAAALAALHPQEFEPEDKWGIAAGVGNYKNATAAAVGLFYRPNERTLLNLGWTMGDSRNMVNAGVSVKLGSGSTYAGFSKVQMANRLTQQEEKITAQEQEIKELREREEQREKQMQEILSKLKMMEKTKA